MLLCGGDGSHSQRFLAVQIKVGLLYSVRDILKPQLPVFPFHSPKYYLESYVEDHFKSLTKLTPEISDSFPVISAMGDYDDVGRIPRTAFVVPKIFNLEGDHG